MGGKPGSGTNSRFPPGRFRPKRAARGKTMLYWLSGLAGELSAFNIFRYITFRTGGALITALLFVFLFGPIIIRSLPSPTNLV